MSDEGPTAVKEKVPKEKSPLRAMGDQSRPTGKRERSPKEKSPVPAAESANRSKSNTAAAKSSGRPKEKAPAERGKAVAEARQSVIAARTQSIRTLFRDSWSEMKKVNWPDQETTRNLTVVVIGISVVLGITLGGIDFLLQKLFELMT